jgi:plastocyanin
MREPRPGAAATLAAALALAGCGAGTPPPGRHIVEIRNFVFAPAALAVRDGDRVVFVNHDAVPHTATADAGGWDTGNIAAGDSAAVTVAKGGGAYHCTYHPTMKGALNGK